MTLHDCYFPSLVAGQDSATAVEGLQREQMWNHCGECKCECSHRLAQGEREDRVCLVMAGIDKFSVIFITAQLETLMIRRWMDS